MTNTAQPPKMGGRSFLRFGLAGLAVEMLLIGIPASIAPEWFFHWFFMGRGWAGAIGPYNSHYVLDLGFTYLGLGTVIVWATLRLGLQLSRAVLVGSIVANLPHLIFHLNHTHAISFWDNVAQDAFLGSTIVMALIMLQLLWMHPEIAEVPSATALSTPREAKPLSLTGAGERR